MDDAAPTILRLPPPAWDAESIRRRIAQLETALMRRSELLEQKQAELDAIKASESWYFARLICRVQGRLLPVSSRRRRLIRTAQLAAGRLKTRLARAWASR